MQKISRRLPDGCRAFCSALDCVAHAAYTLGPADPVAVVALVMIVAVAILRLDLVYYPAGPRLLHDFVIPQKWGSLYSGLGDDDGDVPSQ